MPIAAGVQAQGSAASGAGKNRPDPSEHWDRKPWGWIEKGDHCLDTLTFVDGEWQFWDAYHGGSCRVSVGEALAILRGGQRPCLRHWSGYVGD